MRIRTLVHGHSAYDHAGVRRLCDGACWARCPHRGARPTAGDTGPWWRRSRVPGASRRTLTVGPAILPPVASRRGHESESACR